MIFASTTSPTKDINLSSFLTRKEEKCKPWALVITTHSATTIIFSTYSKLSFLRDFSRLKFSKSFVLSVFMISACSLNCLWGKTSSEDFSHHRELFFEWIHWTWWSISLHQNSSCIDFSRFQIWLHWWVEKKLIFNQQIEWLHEIFWHLYY